MDTTGEMEVSPHSSAYSQTLKPVVTKVDVVEADIFPVDITEGDVGKLAVDEADVLPFAVDKLDSVE